MVNDLRRMGYDAFALHTDLVRDGLTLPMRHGVTVMTRFKPLAV